MADAPQKPEPEQVTAWLRAARAGSREALGRLLEACRPYLLLVANQHLQPELRGKVSPSDLVQETFLKAHGAFALFQGETEEDLLAWLRTILRNHLANVSRHFQGTDRRQVGREVALGADEAGGNEGSLVAPTPSPGSAAIAREEARALHEALSRLPEEARQVIYWKNWERLSFEEIGRRTGRSADAARKAWSRAVEQLGEYLEPPDEPRRQ